MGHNWNRAPSLCWDCANATNVDICPWARDGTPVEGWNATKCRVAKRNWDWDSYNVHSCPKFKRDAERAGLKKYQSKLKYEPLRGENGHDNRTGNDNSADGARNRVAESADSRPVDGSGGAVADRKDGRTQRAVTMTEYRDILELSYGILERAVLDWQSLEYGNLKQTLLDGVLVTRAEVVRFFFGEWFKHLVDATGWTEQQFRRYIHMPEDAMTRYADQKGDDMGAYFYY